MTSPKLVVIATRGSSAGFALAGVQVLEAEDAKDTARELARLEDSEGVVIVDQRLYEELSDELRRSLGKSATPVVIPVPGPDWGDRINGTRVHRRDPAPGDRLSCEAPMNEARITRVAGAIAEAQPLGEAALYELVEVGERHLLGEVIRLRGEVATIQVFEETSGARSLGEPVQRTGNSLTTRARPWTPGFDPRRSRETAARARRPDRATSSLRVRPCPPSTRRPSGRSRPVSKRAPRSKAATYWATIEERPGMVHRVLVPPGGCGRIADIESGNFNVTDPVANLDDGSTLSLSHPWTIRERRPMRRRLPGDRPFITGQRVFDLLFPVVEGGAVAVPGGFGTGKTVIEQSLAKYAKADVMVYIGCGERGNEMAEVLHDFGRLTDPETGRPIMDRTVLIVNTSNMPVAARDASVYLGMTIAEYYRDMGYHVAILADSLVPLGRSASGDRRAPSGDARGRRLPDVLGQPHEPPVRAGRPRGERGHASAHRRGDVHQRDISARRRLRRAGYAGLASGRRGTVGARRSPCAPTTVPRGRLGQQLQLVRRRRRGVVLRRGRSRLVGAPRRETIRLLQRDRELREIAGLVGVDALEDEDRLVLEARTNRARVPDRSECFSPTRRVFDRRQDVSAAPVCSGRSCERGQGGARKDGVASTSSISRSGACCGWRGQDGAA